MDVWWFFSGLKVANMVVKRLPSRVERERGWRREKDTWWKMKDKALFLIFILPSYMAANWGRKVK